LAVDRFPIDSPFDLEFPCFAIQSRHGRGGVVQPFDNGLGFVLMTDPGHLQRYRQRHGFRGHTVRFNDAGELIAYLGVLVPGVTHVIVDPDERSASQYRLEPFRRTLVEKHGGGEMVQAQ
jgi:hypothetical protein